MKTYTLTLTAFGELQETKRITEEEYLFGSQREKSAADELYNQFVSKLGKRRGYPPAVVQVRVEMGSYTQMHTYTRSASDSPFSRWEIDFPPMYLVFLDTVENKAKFIPYFHEDEVSHSVMEIRHATRIFACTVFPRIDANYFTSEINKSLEWEVRGNDTEFEVIPTYIVEGKAHEPTRYAEEIGTRRPVRLFGPHGGVTLESYATYQEAAAALEQWRAA